MKPKIQRRMALEAKAVFIPNYGAYELQQVLSYPSMRNQFRVVLKFGDNFAD